MTVCGSNLACMAREKLPLASDIHSSNEPNFISVPSEYAVMRNTKSMKQAGTSIVLRYTL